MIALTHTWYYKITYSAHGPPFFVAKATLWHERDDENTSTGLCTCFIDSQHLVTNKMLTTFSSLSLSLTFPCVSSLKVIPSFNIRIVQLCIVNLICLQASTLGSGRVNVSSAPLKWKSLICDFLIIIPLVKPLLVFFYSMADSMLITSYSIFVLDWIINYMHIWMTLSIFPRSAERF